MTALNPRSESLLVWVVCLISFAGTILALRFWAARVIKRRIYTDDLMVIVAYTMTLVTSGLLISAMYHGGLGKHSSELTPAEAVVLAKFNLSGSLTRLWANATSKFSVLFLYNRIFTTINFRHWSYVLMAGSLSYGISFTILFTTRCRPIYQPWNPGPGGWCRDSSIENLISPCVSLLLDFTIVILPIPVLWGLQMPVQRRVAAIIMFSLGFIAVGVMCWRVYSSATTFRKPGYDTAYGMTDLYLIVMLELYLSVIASCVPTLAPLITKYLQPMVSKIITGSSQSQVKPRVELNTIGSPSRRVYHKLRVSQFSPTGTTRLSNLTDISFEIMPIMGSDTGQPQAVKGSDIEQARDVKEHPS